MQKQLLRLIQRGARPRHGCWLASLIAALLLIADVALGDPIVVGPKTQLHYAPNGNFDSHGNFVPGRSGFNLADVGSVAELHALAPDTKALVWVGQCNGVDDAFLGTVQPFIGNPKVFGFFLMDDPDPRGISNGRLHAICKAGDLKAASEWIHAHMPGAKTFVTLMNMSSSKTPSFDNTYNPANTSIDLFGISPYPCRTELGGCDYPMIERYVRAAEAAGVPIDGIIPVYQAFGGGKWRDEDHGEYTLPTIDEACQILSLWQRLVRTPTFDVTYSWGVQRGDIALVSASELRKFFSLRNERRLDTCRPTASK
jgi:hypothetical protein